MEESDSGENLRSPSLQSHMAASEGPPVPNAAASSSQTLRQSSLWESAGRTAPQGHVVGARGRVRGRGSAEGDSGPRFERLSTLAMELGGFRNHADGGGSSLFSDEEDASNVGIPTSNSKRKRCFESNVTKHKEKDTKKGNGGNNDDDNDDDDDDDD